MKYCIKCGTKLPDEAVFCSKCGTKVLTEEKLPSPRELVEKTRRPSIGVPEAFIREKLSKLVAREKFLQGSTLIYLMLIGGVLTLLSLIGLMISPYPETDAQLKTYVAVWGVFAVGFVGQGAGYFLFYKKYNLSSGLASFIFSILAPVLALGTAFSIGTTIGGYPVVWVLMLLPIFYGILVLIMASSWIVCRRHISAKLESLALFVGMLGFIAGLSGVFTYASPYYSYYYRQPFFYLLLVFVVLSMFTFVKLYKTIFAKGEPVTEQIRPEVRPAYCPNCGREVKPTWLVCANCGMKLKER